MRDRDDAKDITPPLGKQLLRRTREDKRGSYCQLKDSLHSTDTRVATYKNGYYNNY
jgi:hypothetical protein